MWNIPEKLQARPKLWQTDKSGVSANFQITVFKEEPNDLLYLLLLYHICPLIFMPWFSIAYLTDNFVFLWLKFLIIEERMEKEERRKGSDV